MDVIIAETAYLDRSNTKIRVGRKYSWQIWNDKAYTLQWTNLIDDVGELGHMSLRQIPLPSPPLPSFPSLSGDGDPI